MEVAVLGAKYTQEEDMLDMRDDDGMCQGFIQDFPLGVGYRRWGYRR